MAGALRLSLALAVAVAAAPFLAGSGAIAAGARQDTLEKVKQSGILLLGTRTASPPFAFRDGPDRWDGFSVDLAKLVHAAVEKRLGQRVRLEFKATTPATRISLLESGAVDLIAETMTVTRARRRQVDFSMVFFVTGAQLLVKRGSGIRGARELAGRRIGALQGSTTEAALRERLPSARVELFADQEVAVEALMRGKIDAYANDGVQLAGLKAGSPTGAELEVVGDPFSYEPYAMAMRRDDAEFRHLVDTTLMEAIERGEYEKLYDRWFGPRGRLPYPLSEPARVFLQMQVVPR